MKKEYKPKVRKIVTYGDESGILLRRASEVPFLNIRTSGVRDKIADLVETCRRSGLIGISAPQIGWSARVIVMWIKPTATRPNYIDKGPTVMVNPHIEICSTETEFDWEGCGSLPGIFAKVDRYTRIVVGYFPHAGRKKKTISLSLSGLEARIVQHEIDHLDGKSFIERADRRTVVTAENYKRIMAEKHERIFGPRTK